MRFGYLCGSDGDPLMKRQRISPNRMFVDENHSSERIEFARLMQALRPGDVVFVESLDQLGSTGREISRKWLAITLDKKAHIVVLDEPLLDTRIASAPVSEVAQALIMNLENSTSKLTHRRQSEGIATARENGVRFGRPRLETPENFANVVMRWENKELKFAEVLELTGFNVNTFYRRLRAYRALKSQDITA